VSASVVTVTCDWSYRGMTACYDGSHSFGMNVGDDEPHDDVVDRAYERARREVSRRMAFSQGAGVQIKNLQLDGGSFGRR